MNGEETFEEKIENLLKNRIEIEATLKTQHTKISQLNAHKMTLTTALTAHTLSNDYPVVMKYSLDTNPIEVEGKYPFYVLNLGFICESSASGSDGGIMYPCDYKVIRVFSTHRRSNSSRREILYTSSIISKGGERYYLIRDDENNMCKGKNAFELFKGWFDFELPFESIEEWLGLTHPTVLEHITQPSLKRKSNENYKAGTLDGYFNRE